MRDGLDQLPRAWAEAREPRPVAHSPVRLPLRAVHALGDAELDRARAWARRPDEPPDRAPRDDRAAPLVPGGERFADDLFGRDLARRGDVPAGFVARYLL